MASPPAHPVLDREPGRTPAQHQLHRPSAPSQGRSVGGRQCTLGLIPCASAVEEIALPVTAGFSSRRPPCSSLAGPQSRGRACKSSGRERKVPPRAPGQAHVEGTAQSYRDSAPTPPGGITADNGHDEEEAEEACKANGAGGRRCTLLSGRCT